MKWTILESKPRNTDCDFALIDRGADIGDMAFRWVVGTVNSQSINNGEWFWGHYFNSREEAKQYFDAQPSKVQS